MKRFKWNKKLVKPREKPIPMCPMITMGHMLNKQRESLGLSLSQVSNETKISITKLKFMEENQFDSFESPTHVKGFLKIYAEYLDLEPERVLAIYRRTYNATNEKTKETDRKIKEVSTEQKNTKYLVLTIPLLITILFLAYLYSQYYNYQNPPYLEIFEPKNNITTEKNEVNIKGKTEPNTIININNTTTTTDENYIFEKTVLLQPGINIITIKATHATNTNRESIEILSIEYQEIEEEKEEAEEKKEIDDEDEEEKNIIKLEIQNIPTWVEVIIDDQFLMSQVLPAKHTEEFKPKKNITISTSVKENIIITLDEIPIMFPLNKLTISCEIIEDEIECN